MEEERIAHEVFNTVCSGTQPHRDTVAAHQIPLVTFFCVSMYGGTARGIGTYLERFWVKIPDYFCLSRACRKTPLRVMGCLLASLLSLSGSCFCGSVCPDTFSLYLLARTTSRINLFRLNERTDRGPAISSVCHRRSLGLLNPYLSVFRVPMIPSVLPRSLRTVSRTASATCHGPGPLGWMPISLTPSWASALTVAVA